MCIVDALELNDSLKKLRQKKSDLVILCGYLTVTVELTVSLYSQ